VPRKLSEFGELLRTGARELPSNASWLWGRVGALGTEVRSRAATAVTSRGHRAKPLDADNMTKDELMDLARKEQVKGRSSMTKAQLAAALRRMRRS
jgi:hypothetical protein